MKSSKYEKYHSIAKEVSETTPMSRKQVLEQISRVIDTFSHFYEYEWSVDEKITTEYIRGIVMHRVRRGLF